MKLLFQALFIASFIAASGCNQAQTEKKETSGIVEAVSEAQTVQKAEEETAMKIRIGHSEFSVTMEDNSSAEALKELMTDGSLTLDMRDYGGMEKNADIGTTLPQNNIPMDTEPGDIILYQGRTLAIYYDTNSWSLTPIGKIDNVNADELRKALGTGNVTVTFYRT